MAQQYYKKPTSMGGGGNDFTGWSIPAGLDSTANGTYAPPAITATDVTIIGTGTEPGEDGTSPVEATCIVP